MAAASELILNVVTPERSMVNQVSTEAIVLPGEMGQLMLLPGHINFITSLSHGSFGYKVNGEWQIAFLSGGFTQVYDGKVTVLAETMEMAAELDLAEAELQLQEITNKIKGLKVDSPEYAAAALTKEMSIARIKAAQKKLH